MLQLLLFRFETPLLEYGKYNILDFCVSLKLIMECVFGIELGIALLFLLSIIK